MRNALFYILQQLRRPRATNLTAWMLVRVSVPPLISSDSGVAQAISPTLAGIAMVMSPPRSEGRFR